MPIKSLKFSIVFLLFTHALCAKPEFSLDSIPHLKSGWIRDSRVISFGVGFANFDLNRRVALMNTKNFSISSLKMTTPFYAKLEFFLSKHLGIGISANYNSVEYYYNYSYIKYNQKVDRSQYVLHEILAVNIRVNYHIFYRKKFDVYIGGASGLRVAKTNVGGDASTALLPNGFFREHDLTLGIRYHFKKIGIYAESGFTRSLFQAGICYNLNN